jgi:hypothetical protein
MRGVVGDKPEPVAGLAQPRDGLRAAEDRVAGDVEDAVDVQQDGAHRYSLRLEPGRL